MTQRRKIHRFRLDDTGTGYPVSFKEDLLAAEEPLEIRLNGTSFAVTMRTPGDDFDLVAGFLVSEGVVRHASELISLRFCAGTRDGEQTFNVVDAQLHPGVALPDTKRNVSTSSSCGICGIAVSAPSSLAAHLAAETGVTLVGFNRGTSLNVYSGQERLALPHQEAAMPT